MAARPLEPDVLKQAVQSYCQEKGLSFSQGEDMGRQRWLLEPGNIKVILIPPATIECEDPAIKAKLAELVMEMRTPAEPPAPIGRDARPPAIPGKEEFSVENWRKRQDRSYNVSGKQAPNAFAASEEANRRGLSTQIMDAGRSKDLVWGQVRVVDPKTGQFREDRVSHERETFCLLKAWEDANSQARYMKGQQLIVGIQENNMPELNPDIKIKGMPAQLWLTLAIMRAWTFADRDAITKAERRAQLKILNREWREDDEIQLETEEERAVKEAA
jgi:hypothetical protein